MNRGKSIAIVALVTAGVVALWVFIFKKILKPSGEFIPPDTIELLEHPHIELPAEVVTPAVTTTTAEDFPIPRTPASEIQKIEAAVAYKKLPRDSTGQIVQDTTELDTYCEQEAARLVLYKVRWACYLGAQGQITGKYYDYYEKYVEAPKDSPDQAKAIASCPSGVKPSAVYASFIPRP